MNDLNSNTLGELMDEIMSLHPSKEALIAVGDFRVRKLTYAQLGERLSAVAAWLGTQGLKKGDRLVICAPNSAESLVLMLACGLVQIEGVPVDQGVSPEALEVIVEASGASLIATSRQDILDADQLGAPRYPIRCLFEDAGAREIPPGGFVSLAPGASSDDLLYLFFTSGTTGAPKCVPISHGNLVSNIRNQAEVDDWARGDRALNMAPLNHVFGIAVGLMVHLLCGNTVVISSETTPARLVKILKEQDITCIATVPVFLDRARAAIEAKLEASLGRAKLDALLRFLQRLPISVRRRLAQPILNNFAPSLQWAASGGAALSPVTQRFWESLGVMIVQGYGLTETIIAVSSSFSERTEGSVGHVVPGQEISIDESGEILLRGPNVFAGYLDAPEINQKSFVDGWYRTGDLGRIDERGRVFITGRAKNVIIGPSGLNIYPEDIELLLNEHPDVMDSLVLESPAEPGRLWAAVLPKAESRGLDPESLKRELNARLGSYQRLQRIVIWDDEDFPRTGSKKIVRPEVEARVAAGMGEPEGRDAPEADDRAGGEDRAGGDDRDELLALIGRLSDVPVEQLSDATSLGADLGLDSLGVADLLASAGELLGRPLAFEQVAGGDVTIGDIRRLGLEGGATEPREVQGRDDGDGALVRVNQRLTRHLIPALFRRVFDLDVSGLQRLERLGDEPYLVIANHGSHLDWMSIWTALPLDHRRRLCPAAAFDFFFQGKSRGAQFMFRSLAPFLPWRRDASPKQALEAVAERLDRGMNVLVFPEGTRSRTGELAEFKATIGLLARELEAPVLPVFLEGTHQLWPPQARMPTPGAITVTFGEPRRFSWRDRPHEIRDSLEALYRGGEAAC